MSFFVKYMSCIPGVNAYLPRANAKFCLHSTLSKKKGKETPCQEGIASLCSRYMYNNIDSKGNLITKPYIVKGNLSKILAVTVLNV